MDAIGFDRHDHNACISDGVTAADAYCREAGLKLTAVRRRVLQMLLEQHRALGAYEILDTLRDEGFSAQPPVAYRALDFLTKHGFAHRVERLNAFIACTHPGQPHTPAFLICRICNAVAEALADPSEGRLGQAAQDVGFSIERAAVEVEGVCPNCQTSHQT